MKDEEMETIDGSILCGINVIFDYSYFSGCSYRTEKQGIYAHTKRV